MDICVYVFDESVVIYAVMFLFLMLFCSIYVLRSC